MTGVLSITATGSGGTDSGCMAMCRSVLAWAPLMSVAVMRTTSGARSAAAGVPLKDRVAASNDSHVGSGWPDARLALKRRLSPLSGSTSASAGSTKLNCEPSVACWAASAVANGVSLMLTIVNTKSCVALAPAASVANTRSVRLPTSALVGVPLKLRLVASNVNQPGNGAPLVSVADQTSVSPVSMSAKAAAGKLRLNPLSSMVSWLPTGVAAVGASLTLTTTSTMSCAALAPATSVARTRSVRLPTSALVGVPLKLRLVASNVSQVGSAAPLASVADQVSVSPASTSVKASAGSRSVNRVSWLALALSSACAGSGASLRLPTRRLKFCKLSLAPSLAATATL